MKPLSALHRLIRPYANGVATPLMNQAIRDAARKFCEETRLWRSDDTISTTRGECSYPCAPAGAEIVEIKSASFNGRQIEAVRLNDLDAYYPDWRNRTDLEQPLNAEFITQINVGSVAVYPNQGGKLRVWTVLKPSMDCVLLPDFLIDQYGRAIADGALGDILVVPKKDYTDFNLAGAYTTRFVGMIESLASQSVRGQQRAKLRSKPNFF